MWGRGRAQSRPIPLGFNLCSSAAKTRGTYQIVCQTSCGTTTNGGRIIQHVSMAIWLPILSVLGIYLARMVELRAKRDTLPGQVRETRTLTWFVLTGTLMLLGSLGNSSGGDRSGTR